MWVYVGDFWLSAPVGVIMYYFVVRLCILYIFCLCVILLSMLCRFLMVLGIKRTDKKMYAKGQNVSMFDVVSMKLIQTDPLECLDDHLSKPHCTSLVFG